MNPSAAGNAVAVRAPEDEPDVPSFLKNMELEFARRQAAKTVNTSVGNCPFQPTLVDINRAKSDAERTRRSRADAEARAEREAVERAMKDPEFAACVEELRAAWEDTPRNPYHICGARRYRAEHDFLERFRDHHRFIEKEARRLEFESVLRIIEEERRASARGGDCQRSP